MVEDLSSRTRLGPQHTSTTQLLAKNERNPLINQFYRFLSTSAFKMQSVDRFWFGLMDQYTSRKEHQCPIFYPLSCKGLPEAQMNAVPVHVLSIRLVTSLPSLILLLLTYPQYRHCVVCAPRGIHVRVTSMLRLILAPGVSGTSTRALTLAVSSPESSSYASLNLEK